VNLLRENLVAVSGVGPPTPRPRCSVIQGHSLCSRHSYNIRLVVLALSWISMSSSQSRSVNTSLPWSHRISSASPINDENQQEYFTDVHFSLGLDFAAFLLFLHPSSAVFVQMENIYRATRLMVRVLPYACFNDLGYDLNRWPCFQRIR
jgi:hypothetical protein